MSQGRKDDVIDKNAIAAQIAVIIGVGLERSRAIVDAFEYLFVDKVVEKLAGIKMKELVERKNPYLYRATGVATCEEYIQRAFREYVAGMRWTYFGHFCESVASYMWGQSQGYAPFTQRALLELLDRFAEERALPRRKRGEIRAWLRSLPWVEGGWRTRLPKDDGRSRAWGYHPLHDNDDWRDGGLVELHFSW